MAEIASAFVSLLPSVRGFRSKLDSQISGDIDKTGKKAGLSFGKIFAGAAALGVGAKAFSFLGDSLAEGREATVIGARTANVIKEMGNAANISAKGVSNLAGQISAKSGIDDEAIQSGQNLLLTFGNIRNEAGRGNKIFDQTSQLMVDMSAAMGTDAKAAALQLGKALNDPTKGVTALTRSGVSFTEQQKAQIKTLTESGNILGAQKVILGEVSKQFGGAAESMATPADKAKVAIGNLKETIGTALLPAVDSVTVKFTGFVNGMQTGEGAGGKFAAVAKTIGSNLGTIAPVVGVLVSGLAAYRVATLASAAASAVLAAGTAGATGATWSLNAALRANPIGIVVTALTLLAAGLVIAYKKSETFRNIVNGAFEAVKTGAVAVSNFITKTVPAAFERVRSAAATALGWIKSNWPAILGILTGPFGSAATAIGKSWESIKDGGTRVVEFIKTIPSKILGVFSALEAGMYAAGGKLMGMLADGIKAAVLKPYNELKAAADKLKGLLPGSPIKEGPLKPWNNGTPGTLLMDFLARGIKKGGAKTREALSGELDKLTGRLTTLKSDFKSLAESVSGAFTGDLFSGATATVDDLGNVTATAGQNFIASLTAKKGELTSLLASFKTLKGWGLSPTFLSQLFASGNGALITELAGMGQAGALSTASLFGDVTSLGAQLGNAVAKNDFGPNIDRVGDKIEELRKEVKNAPKENAKELGKVVADMRLHLVGGDPGQRAYLRTGGK